METYKIEVILRALELGSLTKAAVEYEYSPSAVSQMLNAIENEIGTQLINRTHTGIEAKEGREEIIALLSDIVKAQRKITAIAAEKNIGKNTVTIATYSSISKHILPAAIKNYKAENPDTDINIIVADNFEVPYRKELADLYLGEKIKSEEIAWEHVLDDPFVAILPKSYDNGSDSISCKELLGNKFILAKDRNISAYIKKEAGEESLISNSSDDSSIIELVRAEMGVSILSRMAVLGVSDIQIKPLSPPICRSLGFMYKKDSLKTKKHAASFMKFLSEYIKTDACVNISSLFA